MTLTPSSGWSKYSDITVGSPSSNYQMKIDLRRGGSHLNNDPANGILYDEYGTGDNGCYYSDMRDVQINSTDDPTTGTRLPQWTEEVDDGVKRVFWVKTNGAEHIYIFVGNQNASEYSDGDATFIFFDDFSGDLSKWTTSDSPSISNGELVLDNDDNVYSINTYGHYGIRVRDRAKCNEQDVGLIALRKNTEPPEKYQIVIKNTDLSDGNPDLSHCWTETKDETYYANKNIPCDLLTNYNTFEITWENGDVYFYQNDNQLSHHTKCVPTVALHVRLYVWDSSQESTEWVDWIFVAKHASTEPSFTNFGAWTDVSGGYADSGLRIYDGTNIIKLAKYSDATTSAFRIFDGSSVIYLVLVDTTDANATGLRIYDGTNVKAVAKYT